MVVRDKQIFIWLIIHVEMLSESQIEKIRDHLARAQNPVFYYDNDADGLCAFLLIRRYIGRGYGVAVRSYPDLDVSYAKKVEQLKADYVFVLDKPFVSKDFIEELDRMQIPVVWIDHHELDIKIEESAEELSEMFKNFSMYNPALNKGDEQSSEPTSYLAYKITKRKEDMWIALMGCIADHYFPDFTREFAERYPEFWSKDVEEPFDVYYKTEIGRLAMGLNFGLKDSVSHVVQMQNFLLSCKGPNEVFLELEINKAFREKYVEIKKKYDELLKKAVPSGSGKIIQLVYSGELSISSDIANNLSYLYSDRYILVAYKKGTITNISLRGDDVRSLLKRVLSKLEDARGGGHRNAVGARIKTEDLERFMDILESEIV